MATRRKRTEQNILADGRHVADAARRHYDVIRQDDARREEKLLPSERLDRFESAIEALDAASGGTLTGGALQIKAADRQSARRTALYQALVEVRAEVKVTSKGNPAIGRAFGVGFALSPRSTPVLLTVGNAVLTSWQDEELRTAAERAGIDAARIGGIAAQVAALGEADTARHTALTRGHGRTLTKKQLLHTVRSETAYVRQVAAVVFRGDPVVLGEFKSTQPRYTVKHRTSPGEAPEVSGEV